ncbi:unnamed protein product [Allacma fusca]|uniref:Uncharacterized protein n=1 Tax=Allacma fusca TaxID=39272 RepID=A0A8J2L889_9HEXA|nr:unnamed protein product [Allacma fusca]
MFPKPDPPVVRATPRKFPCQSVYRKEIYSDHVPSTQTSFNLLSSIHERSALPDSPGLARRLSLPINLGTSNKGGRPGVISKRKASDSNEEADIIWTTHKKFKPGPFPEQTVPRPPSTNLNDLAALILSLKGDITNVETNLTALFESKIQALESKCEDLKTNLESHSATISDLQCKVSSQMRMLLSTGSRLNSFLFALKTPPQVSKFSSSKEQSIYESSITPGTSNSLDQDVTYCETRKS